MQAQPPANAGSNGGPSVDAQATTPSPTTAMAWFERARILENLRGSNSRPFHLRVAFIAGPGTELSGTGTYDEIWRSPGLWRREVSLGSYHVVEGSTSSGLRVSGDTAYLPARIALLITSILHPVPDTSSRQEWSLSTIEQKGVPYTLISEHFRASQTGHMPSAASYLFLPSGLLAVRTLGSTSTAWVWKSSSEGFTEPDSFLVTRAGNSASLLAATAKVESLSKTDDSPFALTGAEVEAISFLDPPESSSHLITPQSVQSVDPELPDGMTRESLPLGALVEVSVDRKGEPRDAELLEASPGFGDAALNAVKKYRFKPAMVQGSAVPVRFRIEIFLR
jgi:TonB family protein